MALSIKRLFPILAIFLLVTLLIVTSTATLARFNINSNVLLGANLFFLVISIFSFMIQQRGVHHKNPHVFVRSVMTGMLLKMVLCIAAVILYVYASGETFNKRAVFISLFLYLLYLAAEVYSIMKMNKNKHA